MDWQRSAQAEAGFGLRLSIFWGVLCAAAVTVLAPCQAGAQWPRVGPRGGEPFGFDLPATGGWRGRVGLVRSTRVALLNSGALARLNAPGAPGVHGKLRVAVIPVLFQGATAPYPASQYQELLFAPAPFGRSSATSYYTAQSRGEFALEGKVFGWVQLSQPESYYTDGCNGIGVIAPCPVRERGHLAEMLAEALEKVSTGPDAATAWSGFDGDGPDGVPDSGDDDGVVDLVVFVHPAKDGACGGEGLWSHRFGIANWFDGHPYLTRTPQRSITGQPIPGAFLSVNAYTLQSAVGGPSACDPTAIMPIGTVAHETGHAFGLPDLYDTDPLSATEGIGGWGLMGSGNYARPYSPSSFDAWSLAQLGWVKLDTLKSGVPVTTAAVQVSDTVFVGRTAIAGTWLMLENRQAVGSDTAMMNPLWGPQTKGPGLLIWLVDEPRILSGMPANRVNTGLQQGLSLFQADGFNQLRTVGPTRNRGDPGDPWPGASSNHDFGLASTPAARTWDGRSLDVRVDGITEQAGGKIRFRYIQRAPSLVAAHNSPARIKLDAHFANSISEVFLPGDIFSVAADSWQVTFDGRSASRFLSWSDGGARNHSVAARSGTPDTIFADFAVQHRIRVTTEGPGTVNTNSGSLTGAGIFLDQGARVTLTAQAGGGADFLGWRGDTTTASAIVNVTVDAPRDFTAIFSPTVLLNSVTVLHAVLGGPTLPAASENYLDALGNRNGIFDVGDYLAWIRRTGQPMPPLPHPVGGS